jgi:PAS domain S-box-containing protein
MGIALSAAAELGFEHSLRIREAQLREAMALAGLGVWEWDVALGIVTWSPELRRILGVDDGCKASVQAFMALVHADDRAWAEKAMRESLRTGFALETPFRVVRPDGSTRVLKGRATTSRFANGAPAYMVGALQDLGSAKFFPDLDRDRAALDSMSERERQVLVLVAQGGTSREIASRLRLSPKTVETYRSRLMSKLGLEGLADLVRFSIRYRVITP